MATQRSRTRYIRWPFFGRGASGASRLVRCSLAPLVSLTLRVNAFRAVLVLFAVLGASSAATYMNGNGQTGWSSAAASPAGSADAYAQRPGAGGQQTSTGASYGMMSSAPAGAAFPGAAAAPAAQGSFNSGSGQGASSTSQQICTCVTLPAAPQAPAFNSAAAPAAPAAPATPFQPIQQAAPVAQNAYAAAPALPQTSFNTGKAY